MLKSYGGGWPTRFYCQPQSVGLIGILNWVGLGWGRAKEVWGQRVWGQGLKIIYLAPGVREKQQYNGPKEEKLTLAVTPKLIYYLHI